MKERPLQESLKLERLNQSEPRILFMDSSEERAIEFESSGKDIFQITAVVSDSNNHEELRDKLIKIARKLNHGDFDFLVYNIDSFNIDPSIFKEAYPNLSLVILTEDTTPENAKFKSQLLRSGADHVQTIPANPDLLLAHIHSIQIRRSEGIPVPNNDVIKFGEISMDLASRRVKVEGKSIYLSRIEFKLLTILILNESRVISPAELISRTWENGYLIDSHQIKNLRSHISRLRTKLGDCGKYIQNQKGLGYLFSDEQN